MNENEIEKRILEINEKLAKFEYRKFLLNVKQQELNTLTNIFNIELKIEKDEIITNLKKEINGLQYEEKNWIIRLIDYIEKKNIF
jgi:hypothetical protein